MECIPAYLAVSTRESVSASLKLSIKSAKSRADVNKCNSDFGNKRGNFLLSPKR